MIVRCFGIENFRLSGKIKYYTIPPEDDSNSVHISASIVSEIAKEFDLGDFESMESQMLNDIETNAEKTNKPFVLESMGQVVAEEKMEEDKTDDLVIIVFIFELSLYLFFSIFQLSNNINVNIEKKVKSKKASKIPNKKIAEPENDLEGNRKLNKLVKKKFKADVKNRLRKEKVEMQLADGLENFTISTKSETNYDFGEDYKM